jgi:hypothetical protein
MEGPSLWDTSTQGVIPRAIDKLFQSISEADIHTAFTVSVSYYEVRVPATPDHQLVVGLLRKNS